MSNQKTIKVRLSEAASPARVGEAATVKSRVLRLSRELGTLLADKALPAALRSKVESFQADLKKTWKELETEATQDGGHKAVASKEDGALGEYYAGEDFCYIPPGIISFAQLEAAETAREIGEDMRERVGQFTDMLNNIFFWLPDSELPDKLSAAQNLFDEFVQVIGAILTGGEETASVTGAADTTESESFAESYQPAVSLVEADGSADPRSVLEMDVQLIRPGWGNPRDNHYYPAEMLRRDAHIFEGAKMYTTDHRQEEKSERTEVSQIKSIIGFTEAGAPIARVVVFDPEFAEKCRNRKKAGMLESLECSILADGKARPGFEEGGRKGKVVEALTAVSSVDWVTRAGAGGKALSLAESSEGTGETTTEEVPAQAEETAASAATQNVTLTETEPEVETPVQEETQESQPPEAPPAIISREEIRAALTNTHLPPASVAELAFGEYTTTEALQVAIEAEVKRIKEISGSGRPFGLGESGAPVQKPVTRASIEETMDRINSRFGIGR